MAHPVNIAVAQKNAVLGDVSENLRRAEDAIRSAATSGAALVVLPECYLTGYVTSSRAQTLSTAIEREGPELRRIVQVCQEHDMHVIVGFLERENAKCYNSAAVIGPDGIIGIHRKRHLPFIGADRFVDAPEQEKPEVFDTEVGRIGIAICYEIRFPEVMRTLALEGADLIVLPTNWPEHADFLADHFTRVRAAENVVYLAVANRGDSEEGVEFLGASQIVDPTGELIERAGSGEALLVSQIDLDRSREKTLRFRNGELELPLWKDRRPAEYRL
jgi:predicted amidohydrolase